MESLGEKNVGGAFQDFLEAGAGLGFGGGAPGVARTKRLGRGVSFGFFCGHDLPHGINYMVTEGTEGGVAASNADYVTPPGNFLQAEFHGSFEVELLGASPVKATGVQTPDLVGCGQNRGVWFCVNREMLAGPPEGGRYAGDSADEVAGVGFDYQPD
jgi:hypothetical protein